MYIIYYVTLIGDLVSILTSAFWYLIYLCVKSRRNQPGIMS